MLKIREKNCKKCLKNFFFEKQYCERRDTLLKNVAYLYPYTRYAELCVSVFFGTLPCCLTSREEPSWKDRQWRIGPAPPCVLSLKPLPPQIRPILTSSSFGTVCGRKPPFGSKPRKMWILSKPQCASYSTSTYVKRI